MDIFSQLPPFPITASRCLFIYIPIPCHFRKWKEGKERRKAEIRGRAAYLSPLLPFILKWHRGYKEVTVAPPCSSAHCSSKRWLSCPYNASPESQGLSDDSKRAIRFSHLHLQEAVALGPKYLDLLKVWQFRTQGPSLPSLYIIKRLVLAMPCLCLPAPGDEGSKPLEASLHAFEACSASFFLELPSADLWDFFLFFTRILYIKSPGLGRGTPRSSW